MSHTVFSHLEKGAWCSQQPPCEGSGNVCLDIQQEQESTEQGQLSCVPECRVAGVLQFRAERGVEVERLGLPGMVALCHIAER